MAPKLEEMPATWWPASMNLGSWVAVSFLDVYAYMDSGPG